MRRQARVVGASRGRGIRAAPIVTLDGEAVDDGIPRCAVECAIVLGIEIGVCEAEEVEHEEVGHRVAVLKVERTRCVCSSEIERRLRNKKDAVLRHSDAVERDHSLDVTVKIGTVAKDHKRNAIEARSGSAGDFNILVWINSTRLVDADLVERERGSRAGGEARRARLIHAGLIPISAAAGWVDDADCVAAHGVDAARSRMDSVAVASTVATGGANRIHRARRVLTTDRCEGTNAPRVARRAAVDVTRNKRSVRSDAVARVPPLGTSRRRGQIRRGEDERDGVDDLGPWGDIKDAVVVGVEIGVDGSGEIPHKHVRHVVLVFKIECVRSEGEIGRAEEECRFCGNEVSASGHRLAGEGDNRFHHTGELQC